MNAVTTTQDTKAIAPFGGSNLVPHNMDEAIRLAEFMARARTVPKHLWDSPGDCLMVVELAMRWGMSPFAVAQATSVINGKQMIEGKLVAAAVESVGAIVGQFEYEFSGEGEKRAIEVRATRRGETNPRTVTVKLEDAKTNNQMWVKQPDQQLVYHGVRVWARRWTPAVILGVYSREEMGPIIEGEAVETPPAPDARDAINASVPLKAAAAPMPPPEKIVDKTKVYEPPPPRNGNGKRQRGYREILDSLRIALRDAKQNNASGEEVNRIICAEEILVAKDTFKDEALAELNSLISGALKIWFSDPPTEEELGEVEIEGSEKMAAG